MATLEKIELAAKMLRESEKNKLVCEPIREIIGAFDIEAAYQVQKINADIRRQSGAISIGHKIGLTAPTVQKQLGVDQPDYGLLWNDKEVANSGQISVSELIQPKAEAEIAFLLAKDLDKPSLTTLDVIQAVDYAFPAIEIVGSRVKDWDIKITDTIADNASASHWVIGHQPARLSDFDVVNCKMTMTNNDTVVSEGIGKACLGSPINALLWLAKKMMELQEPLKAGDLIFTGALGPMVNVKAGDNYNVNIEGLGKVSIGFTE